MNKLTALGINLLYEDADFCRKEESDIVSIRPDILIQLIDRLRDAERNLDASRQVNVTQSTLIKELEGRLSVPDEYHFGYAEAMSSAQIGVRQLYIQHCHHHGVDGLLNRCKELEQSFIASEENGRAAMLAKQPGSAAPYTTQQEAENVAWILEKIASFESHDIDSDTLDLRFEDENGRDTGSDISIVDSGERGAKIIRILLAKQGTVIPVKPACVIADENEFISNFIRDICESDPDNPNDENVICISAANLKTALEVAFEQERGE